jgi:hypothetical protein
MFKFIVFTFIALAAVLLFTTESAQDVVSRLAVLTMLALAMLTILALVFAGLIAKVIAIALILAFGLGLFNSPAFRELTWQLFNFSVVVTTETVADYKYQIENMNNGEMATIRIIGGQGEPQTNQ